MSCCAAAQPRCTRLCLQAPRDSPKPAPAVDEAQAWRRVRTVLVLSTFGMKLEWGHGAWQMSILIMQAPSSARRGRTQAGKHAKATHMTCIFQDLQNMHAGSACGNGDRGKESLREMSRPRPSHLPVPWPTWRPTRHFPIKVFCVASVVGLICWGAGVLCRAPWARPQGGRHCRVSCCAAAQPRCTRLCLQAPRDSPKPAPAVDEAQAWRRVRTVLVLSTFGMKLEWGHGAWQMSILIMQAPSSARRGRTQAGKHAKATYMTSIFQDPQSMHTGSASGNGDRRKESLREMSRPRPSHLPVPWPTWRPTRHFPIKVF